MSHLTTGKLINLSYKDPTYSNQKTDVQVYTQDCLGITYIVFPGTSSQKDWLTNIRFKPLITPYKGEGYNGQVKIHSGYYLSYLSIREKVLKIAIDSDFPLIVGGHSSGGAIAQIAGVDINFNLNKQVKTITLGTPAIGNKAWQRSAIKRINNTSYANFLDIIPWLMLWNHHVTEPILNYNIYFNPHHIKNYVSTLKIH